MKPSEDDADADAVVIDDVVDPLPDAGSVFERLEDSGVVVDDVDEPFVVGKYEDNIVEETLEVNEEEVGDRRMVDDDSV